MRRLAFFSAICALLMALPLVSAEILFSQPATAYNFGDELHVTLTLHPSSGTTDFARITLLCDDEEVTLHNSLMTLGAGASQDVVLNPRLDSPLFATLQGQCSLRGSFGDDETESQTFILTREITTEVNVPASIVLPGESFSVTGTARKVNGQPLQGFAQFILEESNFSYTRIVTNGAFSFNITLPTNIAPGQHTVRIESYEENDEGVIINEGSAESDIIVQVVLTRGEIEFDTRDATPGESFGFVIYAYDQADNELERDVRYDVYAPNAQESSMTKLGRTGTQESLEIVPSSMPGYWRIEASVGSVTTKKLFYVNELERVTFTLENNDTLVVTNAGNVPYHKSVEISIGNYSSIKELELEVGASKRFKLKAPTSAYDVRVQDGNTSFLATGVLLTGRAIDIGEIRGSVFNLWWAGFFIIVVVALTFVTNVYVSRRRLPGIASKESATPFTASKSASALVGRAGVPVGATREPATMIALRVDSESALARNALDNALGIAHHAGASVTSHMNQHLVAFSPRFTKKLENDLLAVQIAKEIESALKGNAEEGTFDFGIGVGKGEIITHPEKPGQFTSVGTLVPAAKRLAHSSKREVLVSDELHAALRTSLKAEKVAGTNSAWRVSSIVSRESHKSFIDGFLKRQKK